MADGTISARFSTARTATAAVDWFLNQAIDRDALRLRVQEPGDAPRPLRPGDNGREGLTWFVSIDLARVRISKRIAVETMRREGGTIVRDFG